MKISFLSLKVGILKLHKEFRSNFSFFVTAYENSRNFIEHSDFDEKKIDAYDRDLAGAIRCVIVMLMCSILIINLIRTVLNFDYKITKKWVIITFFGLLSTKYYSKT
jgi:putative membrane protein